MTALKKGRVGNAGQRHRVKSLNSAPSLKPSVSVWLAVSYSRATQRLFSGARALVRMLQVGLWVRGTRTDAAVVVVLMAAGGAGGGFGGGWGCSGWRRHSMSPAPWCFAQGAEPMSIQHLQQQIIQRNLVLTLHAVQVLHPFIASPQTERHKTGQVCNTKRIRKFPSCARVQFCFTSCVWCARVKAGAGPDAATGAAPRLLTGRCSVWGRPWCYPSCTAPWSRPSGARRGRSRTKTHLSNTHNST